MKNENDRPGQVEADGTEDAAPEEARAGDRRGLGETLVVLGALGLVGYLVTRSANPVELASVTTAASGLLVAVARAVSTMRKRR